MGTCKWCNGRGYDARLEGGLYCQCGDCNGTGEIPECDICGEEYTTEYCEECYTECEKCGWVTQKDELENGLCEDCREEQN